MKRKILFSIALFGFAYQINAQSAPTTGAAAASSNDWSRSGNLQTTGGNIFGTRWNSPIYTWTGGPDIFRSKLNAIFTPVTQYPINGYNSAQGVNTTGYMLLGPDAGVSSTGQSIYTTKGAFSLLHLNGSGIVQEFGYRPWMKTGITLSDNNDMSYIGLRQVEFVPDWKMFLLEYTLEFSFTSL